MSSPDEDVTARHSTDQHDHARASRFRFKRSSEQVNDNGHRDAGESRHRHEYQRRRHHHGRHKRRKVSNDHTPVDSTLPPDVAFRESLFDALGDDEGAEFWQGVYGQSIHAYPRMYTDAETGQIEMMDDEQYAQYVRRKMWEKSAEGLEAAREAKRRGRKEEEQRRREERCAHKEHPKPSLQDNTIFDFEIEASLKRGQDRKEKKRWQDIWQDYLDRWKDLQAISEARRRSPADDNEQTFLRNKIAWPVQSGKCKDVSAGEIENFFDKVCLTIPTTSSAHASARTSVLKSERIRWHPDKIQQRYGFMQIEPSTMGIVTAVFQVLDRLWNEARDNKS